MATLNREIIRLAIPNIISNISIPLMSSVDTALMGGISAQHLGAIGIGSMVFNFIYWNFGFLRMSTTGLTAQGYGAKDEGKISRTLIRAILVALIIAVALLILQQPILRLSNTLMQVQSEQIGLVNTYFSIRIWAAPATLLLYAFLGWFFGMQNVVYPLIITVFINALNIGLSYYMVVQQGMGVAGAAYGTVWAQYAGIALATILLLFNYRKRFRSPDWPRILDYHSLLKYLSINQDIFIRTLCLTLAFAFFYSQSSHFSAEILAVNVVLLQYVNWMSYGVDGFAYASESIVGKYKGAKADDTLKRAIKLLFIWGGGFALIYTIIYYFFDEPLLKIFTKDAEVLTLAQEYLIWLILFPLVAFACYIWDGIYIGLTAVKAMRNSMLLSFAMYLGIYFLTYKLWGNHSLWLSLLVLMFARGLFQTILFTRQGIHLT